MTTTIYINIKRSPSLLPLLFRATYCGFFGRGCGSWGKEHEVGEFRSRV